MKIHYTSVDGQRFEWEEPDPPHAPLEGLALAATLNAVLGIWSLEEASVIASLDPETLIAEAQAWAVASGYDNN